MSDKAKVLQKRGALDKGLLNLLHKRKSAYPHSHGNYLPALVGHLCFPETFWLILCHEPWKSCNQVLPSS
jgi:hypothetical protein